MYNTDPSALQITIVIFLVILGILWLLVPFILMSINSKLAETNYLLKRQLPNDPTQPEKIGIFD